MITLLTILTILACWTALSFALVGGFTVLRMRADRRLGKLHPALQWMLDE